MKIDNFVLSFLFFEFIYKIEKMKDGWKKIANALRLIAPNDPVPIRKFVYMTLRNHYLQHLHPFLHPEDDPEMKDQSNQTTRCINIKCNAILRYRSGAKRYHLANFDALPLSAHSQDSVSSL